MEKDIKQATDFYRVVAWMHTNRTRLIWISAIVLIVGAGIGIYTWNKSNRETQANEALSKVSPPSSAEESTNAAAAEPYLKVAADYPGTKAAARSLLIAGGILFDAGKFQEAQKRFEQFLGEYSDYPFADEALLGVDSAYEAEGNYAEAATRYRDFIDHHPTSSSLPQVKSALARVYLAENKPDLALQQYEDLERNRNNDSWTAEAGIQKEELLAKYPNLKKQAPAPIVSSAPLTVTPKSPSAPQTSSTNMTLPSTNSSKP
ncbi:MAG TPA: tetratricopeptide repeat protein [Verrucomicrobiae bacterium]|nr:tetratricopeptide repeat protein [Verrucomicrobiae bacterium]